MAEKLRLGNEVKELKIGQSFTNPKSAAFHTLRYDFKPASVDTSKKATVDVGSNHQVTVNVPHLDGSGTTQTVFKGSQRNYTKECVLIVDRVTGEVTLEKLACNIQVKKTRSQYNKAQLPQDRLSQQSNSNNDRSSQSSSSSNTTTNNNPNLTSRSSTPPALGHRVSSKTKVTSGARRPDRQITQLVPKHSPLHASPNYPSPKSSNNVPESHNSSSQNHSTLASLPMIGMDDFSAPPQSQPSHTFNTNPANNISSNSTVNPYMATSHHQNSTSHAAAASDNERSVGEISDTSSSGSSDSESDSEPDKTVVARTGGSGGANSSKTNGYSNGISNTSLTSKMLLNEDLCLSESGSDSD